MLPRLQSTMTGVTHGPPHVIRSIDFLFPEGNWQRLYCCISPKIRSFIYAILWRYLIFYEVLIRNNYVINRCNANLKATNYLQGRHIILARWSKSWNFYSLQILQALNKDLEAPPIDRLINPPSFFIWHGVDYCSN